MQDLSNRDHINSLGLPLSRFDGSPLTPNQSAHSKVAKEPKESPNNFTFSQSDIAKSRSTLC